MIRASIKFLMGHMTWSRPYQGRFVVCRLQLAHSTCRPHIKFGVFAITNYKGAYGNAKCRKWGGLKWLWVTQGHRTHRQYDHSIERIRLTTSYSNFIETMKLSCTAFEMLSLIFQKLRKSRNSDHASFRDNLSFVGWDFLWWTCTPNLKSLALAVPEIS